MGRINEQMNQGYTSGEMTDNICMRGSDPENGIEYHGHWEVEIKDVP